MAGRARGEMAHPPRRLCAEGVRLDGMLHRPHEQGGVRCALGARDDAAPEGARAGRAGRAQGRDVRQLGGRHRELDGHLCRGVPSAARLRHPAMVAGEGGRAARIRTQACAFRARLQRDGERADRREPLRLPEGGGKPPRAHFDRRGGGSAPASGRRAADAGTVRRGDGRILDAERTPAAPASALHGARCRERRARVRHGRGAGRGVHDDQHVLDRSTRTGSNRPLP